MLTSFNPLKLTLCCIPFLLSSGLLTCSDSAISSNPGVASSPDPAPSGGVVALTSLTADMIYRLDQTKLIGRPGSRLIDQDPRFQDIPAVSQGRTPPNLEQIVALKPQLVIGAEGFHDQVLKKLQDLGTPTLTTNIKSWQDFIDLTQTLAQKIEVDPTPLLNRYRPCEPEQPARKTSTLVLVSQQPILAPNKESWAGDLLKRFGANNLAADLQGKSPVGGYITLSAEKILEANPEVILVIDPEQDPLETFKSTPFWEQLSATQTNQVYPFDYYGVSTVYTQVGFELFPMQRT